MQSFPFLVFLGKNNPLVRYLMVWHWICSVTSAWKQAVSSLEKVSPLRRSPLGGVSIFLLFKIGTLNLEERGFFWGFCKATT